MNEPVQPTIRTMTRAEVDLAVAWAAAEGWNPGPGDAEAFHAADPEGFLIAELAGEPVATISAVVYDDAFGFLGFYIVRPDMRGRGLGIAIWRRAMARFGARNVGLDGVIAQQDNYRKSGFGLAYRNVRYGGVPEVNPAGGTVPLARIPFERVASYDRALFPAERNAFLAAWLRLPESTALGLVRGGDLAGYGVIRRCGQGHKIGPLFADDEAAARTLFDALAATAPGETVFLDVPEINPEAVALAAGYGLAPVFETARMYTGAFPAIDLARIFGVTTFELG